MLVRFWEEANGLWSGFYILPSVHDNADLVCGERWGARARGPAGDEVDGGPDSR